MRLILAIIAAVFALPASADTKLIDRLTEQLDRAVQARMEFTQSVTDTHGVTASSAGRLSYLRPANFRLEYTQPHKVKIVSNGTTAWIHDPELNQVVVSNLDAVPGARGFLAVLTLPDVDTRFERSGWSDHQTDIDWLVLDSRVPDQDQFTRCALGFDIQGTIVAVRFTDLLGNKLDVRFDAVETAGIDAGHFTFKIPDGAEVIYQ